MKIQIQGYWGAEIKSIPVQSPPITPEQYLEKNPKIHICDVIIDGNVVGTVCWDGKELGVAFRDDTLAKEFKECITNGWSAHERTHWKDYLEEEIKPYWLTLYNFLKSKKEKEEKK